jgi:hypothetical protein
VGYNDLATRYPDLAKGWHPTRNAPAKPTEVVPGTELKVWWLGTCGHEWKATVNSRASGGTGCPICAESRGERAVRATLDALGVRYVAQWTSPAARDVAILRYDFALLDEQVLIEYDGAQHYDRSYADRFPLSRQVADQAAAKGERFAAGQNRDRIKNEAAPVLGMRLVRVIDATVPIGCRPSVEDGVTLVYASPPQVDGVLRRTLAELGIG